MMLFLDLNSAWPVLKPLVFFIAGITAYALFIFKFYRFLARKNIFGLDLDKYNQSGHRLVKKTLSLIFYIFQYILLFPLFSFFWFGTLTVLLAFLSRNQSLDNILLSSMALVGAVRVTAYFNEDLSKDLAKMLPLALLGIFLIDISYFSLPDTFAVIMRITSKWQTLLYFLMFISSLEFTLRLLYGIISGLMPKKKNEQEKSASKLA